MPKPILFKYLCKAVLLNLVMLSISFAKGQDLKTPLFTAKNIIRNAHNADNYVQYYLKLSHNFTAYDTAYNTISKEVFLKAIANGRYIPVKLKSNDSLDYYQLYKLNIGGDSAYYKLFKHIGKDYYDKYKREGEEFPPFNYVDLNGNIYTNENTKGKIIVFNCWFVACGNCVFEMPKLNKLVKQYKNRNDVIFIGLDRDLKFEVVKFLKNHIFNFSIVPLPDDYFSSRLDIQEYPTSIIVNKMGIITKVVNDPNELEMALRKEASE